MKKFKMGLNIFLEDSSKTRFRLDYIGLTWQDFGSSRAAGMMSMRRDQELPLCLTKTVPAGSKVDILLAKAEPIRNSGSTSVITYLRQGEKKWAEAV